MDHAVEEAVRMMLDGETEAAMNRYNRKSYEENEA